MEAGGGTQGDRTEGDGVAWHGRHDGGVGWWWHHVQVAMATVKVRWLSRALWVRFHEGLEEVR